MQQPTHRLRHGEGSVLPAGYCCELARPGMSIHRETERCTHRVCLYTETERCTHRCMRACTHACTYTRTRTRTRTHMHTRAHAQIYIYTYTHIRIYTRVHMRTRKHAHTRARVHTLKWMDGCRERTARRMPPTCRCRRCQVPALKRQPG